MKTVRICFVCLGNICRSPTAHGVMEHLVAQAGLQRRIVVDSAGTSAYHVGEAADARSRSCAQTRGYDLTSRARRFDASDFERFDYILAMDRQNLEDLLALAPTPEARARVRLFRSFDPAAPTGAVVPDPYHGGPRGFDDVLDLCERACQGLLDTIATEHGLR